MRMVLPHHVPSRFINELASDMNALVGSILGEEAASAGFAPAMDIEESEQGFELSLDVPGVNPDDINIDVEEDHVSIYGTRVAVADADDRKRRVERRCGDFRRTVQLPEAVDQDHIEANYEFGVLTIFLPKVQKKAAKKIVIHQTSPDPVAGASDSRSN